MRLVQLQRPLQAAAVARVYRPTPSTFTLAIRPSINAPSQTQATGNAAVEGRRFAAVKSQGAYKIPNKKTLPKKLGAKKSGGMFSSATYTCCAAAFHPRNGRTPNHEG